MGGIHKGEKKKAPIGGSLPRVSAEPEEPVSPASMDPFGCKVNTMQQASGDKSKQVGQSCHVQGQVLRSACSRKLAAMSMCSAGQSHGINCASGRLPDIS